MSKQNQPDLIPQEYVRNLLDALSEAFHDLAKTPMAVRKRFDYQTLAVLARTIFEGARLLNELPNTRVPIEPESNGTLRLTSPQMVEWVQARLKREKEMKPEA